MDEKKTDRRTMKTKKAIREGLADLLTEKELRTITVQELADKADIHRVTFYKHYLDIYDVYEQMEKDILVEFGLLILQYEDHPANKAFSPLVEYVGNNPKIFKMIFSPHNIGHLRNKLQKLMEGLFRQLWKEKGQDSSDNTTLDYAIHYHSVGCMAILEKWVQNDFAQSKDFIIQTIVRLDQNAQSFLLPGNNQKH